MLLAKEFNTNTFNTYHYVKLQSQNYADQAERRKGHGSGRQAQQKALRCYSD